MAATALDSRSPERRKNRIVPAGLVARLSSHSSLSLSLFFKWFAYIKYKIWATKRVSEWFILVAELSNQSKLFHDLINNKV